MSLCQASGAVTKSNIFKSVEHFKLEALKLDGQPRWQQTLPNRTSKPTHVGSRVLKIPNPYSQRDDILRECSPPTMCHVSHVRCQVSHVRFFFFDKMVKQDRGGSVINGAYPVQLFQCSKPSCLALLSPKTNFDFIYKSQFHTNFNICDHIDLTSATLFLETG